jgi:hypothetical protein
MVKKGEKADIMSLIIEQNSQARLTYEIACQLEPHLPIESYEQLSEKLDELVIDNRRLPLEMFAPYVGNDLFPIKNAEDLVRHLSGGVRTALSLAKSPSTQIRNPEALSILASALQEQPGKRSATPILFVNESNLQSRL